MYKYTCVYMYKYIHVHVPMLYTDSTSAINIVMFVVAGISLKGRKDHLQTVMLAKRFSGLFVAVTATVTGCSFSPLTRI